MSVSKSYLNNLVEQVNKAAMEVHREMGPGLLESIYHRCMVRELMLKGITFQSELQIPVMYKGEVIDTELKCDFFVDGVLVVEIRAVDAFTSFDKSQITTYMALLQAPKGLLINFNTLDFENEGQKVYVNELYDWIRP